MKIQKLMSLKNVAHINVHKHLSFNMLPHSVSTGKKAHLGKSFVVLFY